MEFELQIGPKGTPILFSQFDEVVEFIKTCMAQWNNFNPETSFNVIIRKVPSDTPTLGISTGDGIDVQDVFGRS